jgi:hypothetical protein
MVEINVQISSFNLTVQEHGTMYLRDLFTEESINHFETVKYNLFSIIDKYVEKGPLFAQNVKQLHENCFMVLFYLSE